MKYKFATILATVLLMAAAPALADVFSSFDQQIRVGPTSNLVVQERISVDFPTLRHGIYRDIPIKYKTTAGNPFSLSIQVVSVTDDEGNNLQYAVSANGDDERLTIGDPDVTVTGRQTYVITYRVFRSLLFLTDHDELYWNAIVEPWGDLGLPDKTSVTVILPSGVTADQIRTRCFTAVGSTSDGACQKTAGDGTAQFSAVGTPLTVVVGWPKNIVAPPTLVEQVKEWLADNWIVFWPLIVFAAMFAWWFKRGRDPKVRQPIVVQYGPPEDANPAELGALAKETIGLPEITSTIVHLAVKGYLHIIEKSQAGLLGNSRAYSFELKKTEQKGLAEYETEILNGIFGSEATVGKLVSAADLQTKFYPAAQAAKKEIGSAVTSRGWFSKSPAVIRSIYVGVGLAYLFLVFFIGRGFAAGPTQIISLVLPAGIIMFFGYFMPARTVKGTDAYAWALGFKEYLSKAEKYRLKWEEKENIFEKFLPYAMVFGVVDKWAKAFAGLNTQPPSWYHGSSMNVWSPIIFANTLSTATSSFGHAMMTAPSAKGGGGFGGGGMGGGGFGGGGGGSW